MSCLTQQPVRIETVRGATRKPGLTSEDLTVLKGLQQIVDADTEGDKVNAVVVEFAPRHRPHPRHLALRIADHEEGQVPGNALVVATSVAPILARSGGLSSVAVVGETYNTNALTYDYFERVTLAAWRRQGLYASSTQPMAGFGFAAQGEVCLEIEPSMTHPLRWTDRGSLLAVHALFAYSGLGAPIIERGLDHAGRLAKSAGIELETETIPVESRSSGVHLTLWASYQNAVGGATIMGARGVRIETLVQTGFDRLMEWMQTPATVDSFVVDQMLLPAICAEGSTKIKTSEVTRRLKTMLWVAKQFMPIHLTLRGEEGQPGELTIHKDEA